MTIVEKLAIDILIVYWLLKGLALTNSNINVGNDADFFVSEISNLDVELPKGREPEITVIKQLTIGYKMLNGFHIVIFDIVYMIYPGRLYHIEYTAYSGP